LQEDESGDRRERGWTYEKQARTRRLIGRLGQLGGSLNGITATLVAVVS